MATDNAPQWQCTVCGQIGSVGRCCGRHTRKPLNAAAIAEYQATVDQPKGHICAVCGNLTPGFSLSCLDQQGRHIGYVCLNRVCAAVSADHGIPDAPYSEKEMAEFAAFYSKPKGPDNGN